MEEKKGLWANLEENLAVILMAVVTVLTLAGFVLDFVASDEAVAAVQQLSFYVYAWMVFLGIAVAVKRSSFMRIDILYNAYPDGVRKAVAVLIEAAVAVFCVALAILSFQRLFQVAQSGQVGTVVAIPMSLIYAAPAVGSLLSVVRFVERLARGKGEKGEGK